MRSLNRVILLGTLGPKGAILTFTQSGAPYASFEIYLAELGANGKEFTTRIDCQCFGKKAEAALEIAPGTAVLFEGSLKKRKREERWEVYVSGFALVPMASSPTPHPPSDEDLPF